MRILTLILDFVFPTRDPEGLVRLATPEAMGAYLRPHAIDESVVSLLPYKEKIVKSCITEAKFHDNEKAESLLAAVLFDYLEGWTLDRAAFDTSPIVLIPVPLSRERQKERGYNQVERVVQKVATQLPSIRVDTNLLARVRHTLPQTSLDSEARRINMEHAFAVTTTPDPACTYIVVDDVRTTGTTLSSAMTCLKEAGTSKVYGLSLAH